MDIVLKRHPEWSFDSIAGKYTREFSLADCIQLARLRETDITSENRAALDAIYEPLLTWSLTPGAPNTYKALSTKDGVLLFEAAVKNASALYRKEPKKKRYNSRGNHG